MEMGAPPNEWPLHGEQKYIKFIIVPSKDLAVVSVLTPRSNFRFPHKSLVTVQSSTTSTYFSVCS